MDTCALLSTHKYAWRREPHFFGFMEIIIYLIFFFQYEKNVSVLVCDHKRAQYQTHIPNRASLNYISISTRSDLKQTYKELNTFFSEFTYYAYYAMRILDFSVRERRDNELCVCGTMRNCHRSLLNKPAKPRSSGGSGRIYDGKSIYLDTESGSN